MNARQLRAALFLVENQGLTVAQLRDILFDIDNQDAELRDNFDRTAVREADARRNAHRTQVQP